MIEIALHQTMHKGGILQKEIARKQHISEKYLDQIIASLKTAGLIRNAAGKKSGYILNLPSENISVYDVFKAFNANLEIVECLEEGKECESSQTCPVKEYWNELNNSITINMKNKSLTELVKEQQQLRKRNTENDYQI
jgi:Rrf2 family protein